MKKTLIASLFALGATTMLTAPAYAQDVYFPIIAKGFSHQFWQAVKAGAESAAERNGVKITFEGPNTEAEIDKQTDILNAAIAKKPQGLGFAALDSQAQVPAPKKAAGVRLDVEQAVAARHVAQCIHRADVVVLAGVGDAVAVQVQPEPDLGGRDGTLPDDAAA